MMDQDDAERLLALELRQDFAEARELIAVQASGRGERQRRQRRRKPDQRQRPAPPHEGKAFAVVAAHEVAPVPLGEWLAPTRT